MAEKKDTDDEALFIVDARIALAFSSERQAEAVKREMTRIASLLPDTFGANVAVITVDLVEKPYAAEPPTPAPVPARRAPDPNAN